MKSIFIILSFLSFVAMIIGLIKPAIFQKIFKLQKVSRWKIFGLTIILILLFSGLSEIDYNKTTENKSVAKLEPASYEIIKEEDRIVVQQKVEKLLNSLSPIQREAVYLRYIQELEYAQISEIMNKKETSVRKLVSQAINKIRKENNTLLSLTFISLLFSRF